MKKLIAFIFMLILSVSVVDNQLTAKRTTSRKTTTTRTSTKKKETPTTIKLSSPKRNYSYVSEDYYLYPDGTVKCVHLKNRGNVIQDKDPNWVEDYVTYGTWAQYHKRMGTGSQPYYEIKIDGGRLYWLKDAKRMYSNYSDFDTNREYLIGNLDVNVEYIK